MRDRIEEIVTGLPILKDLPVLGHLFRRTERAKSRTELMVFLTPRIVRTPDELRKLLEEERKRSKYAPPLDQMGQGARDMGQEKGKSDAIVQPGQKQPEQKQPEQSK
jgi:type II secretory pathway component GspD/PulD (secretin)